MAKPNSIFKFQLYIDKTPAIANKSVLGACQFAKDLSRLILAIGRVSFLP